MDIVIHRINTIQQLKTIPTHYGAEVDLRADGSRIIMNHNPFEGGEIFTDYLDNYRHGLLVLNVKEAGIEDEILRMVRSRNITNCFLLDVEFPYLYRASRKGERAIAVRYSEDESIETATRYKSLVDWVWIDTITELPLNKTIVKQLEPFKTCLVCPERWGRPEDITAYAELMRKLNFRPDAVMTAIPNAKTWLDQTNI